MPNAALSGNENRTIKTVNFLADYPNSSKSKARLSNFSMSNIAEILSANDIRPSVPRVLIYQYLIERQTHPTADEIFSVLRKTCPSLSKMTVYNSLNLFAKKSLVQAMKIDVQDMRFDANVSAHMHFVCKKCGKIFDLPFLPEKDLLAKDGFKIDKFQCTAWGFCPRCAKRKRATLKSE